MTPAARSTIDVALWLHARAERAGEHLSAQKLQRLLYLSQARYAAIHAGQAMMPAIFLAGNLGPVEPNVYTLFEAGVPEVLPVEFSRNILEVLETIWRDYGRNTAEELGERTVRDGAYIMARTRGVNSGISLAAMTAAYSAPPERPDIATSNPGSLSRGASEQMAARPNGDTTPQRLQAKRQSDITPQTAPDLPIKEAVILRGSEKKEGTVKGGRAIDSLADALLTDSGLHNGLQASDNSRAKPRLSPGTPNIVKWRPKRVIN